MSTPTTLAHTLAKRSEYAPFNINPAAGEKNSQYNSETSDDGSKLSAAMTSVAGKKTIKGDGKGRKGNNRRAEDKSFTLDMKNPTLKAHFDMIS